MIRRFQPPEGRFVCDFSSKMKPRCPTRVMARGVSAASVRHARARLRIQQRAAHADRSVCERGHRGLDEVVRLRLAKNLLPRPTGGDSPVERSRKVSISLDLSPLLRCAIDEATRIDRSRRAGRCVWLRADLLAGLQPRRRPGTTLSRRRLCGLFFSGVLSLMSPAQNTWGGRAGRGSVI